MLSTMTMSESPALSMETLPGARPGSAAVRRVAPLVLVVDDDTKLAAVLARSLGREGYDCVIAESGDQALWEQAAHDPDALVLDVMIPHPGGVEICGHLRSHGFDGAIVMISARGEASDRAAALRAGADAFLAKPFPLSLLVEVLGTAMEARR